MNAQVATLPTAAESAFQLAVRQARALAASTLVPQQYRGEDNLGNVMVALEVAQRIGASPLSVMQNLHVIQGKPSFSASFLIATVNACGRFTPLRFEVEGSDPAKDDYRVRAFAKDRESGDECHGPWIDWKMVKAEGWSKKAGSKWLTMPALMFMYRAAAFWSRLYAPELSLGIHTTDEVQDFVTTAARVDSVDVQAFTQRLEQRAIEHEHLEGVDTETGEVLPMTTKEIRAALDKAETMADVSNLGPAIAEVPDDDERAGLEESFDTALARVGGQ